MDDYYRVPTLALLSLLVAVFAALYARSRTQRRLLWLIGWTMATVHQAVMTAGAGHGGIGEAVSESSMMLAAVMFLGALSPVAFGRRIRISYAVPFSALLVFFAVSTALDAAPGRFLRLLNLLAVFAAVAVAVHWSYRRHVLSLWFTLLWSIGFGVPCLYLAYIGSDQMVLRLAHSGISILTALLVLAVYRRLSPGVLFTASGFFVWSMPLLMEFLIRPADSFRTPAFRMFNLMKVITAVGMIVLVLEDEARQNESAQNRDRRARAEMEQYSKLDLSVEPHHDFGIQYSEVCETIAAAGRFQRVVILLLDVERKLRVAASSGINTTLASALDSLGKRLSVEEVQEVWRQPKRAPLQAGNVARADLRPWIRPGDELELQNFTEVFAIPITTRSGDLQGMLMLAEQKDEEEPLLPEDLLPLELLVARVAAARENGLLLRRVTRSEKLAGIGRLAGGVAHELNNPLTVVMGYAELIQDSAGEEKIRRDAGIIRSESQRMRQIIESLARFWKPSPSPISAIVVPELLSEVESLRRREYERSGIRFEAVSAAGLPCIHANGDQMRQVLLQILDNAAADAKDTQADRERRIRIEAGLAGNRIQIVISDSGPGFPNPDRVFDPFFTTRPPGEGPALALSLCYSIVREQGGDMCASNLQPHGAAVVIEMPVESLQNGSQPPIDTVSHINQN
jgi:two-component system, NtrC family, sensor kinase